MTDEFNPETYRMLYLWNWCRLHGLPNDLWRTLFHATDFRPRPEMFRKLASQGPQMRVSVELKAGGRPAYLNARYEWTEKDRAIDREYYRLCAIVDEEIRQMRKARLPWYLKWLA